MSNTARPQGARVLIRAVVVGIVLAIACMLLGAVLVQRGTVGEHLIAPLSIVSLSIGCLVCAFLCSIGLSQGGLLRALGAGLIVFLVLACAGALLSQQALQPIRLAISLLCALVASVLGSLLGINLRSKPSGRHRRRHNYK